MSTVFALVRHGACAQMDDLLLGRALDAALDRRGFEQARALGARFAAMDDLMGDLLIRASPRRRTRQTAAAIGASTGRGFAIERAIDEVDFGRWCGRSFAALASDPEWRRWNEDRGRASTPAGDSMAAIQNRALECMRRLHALFRGRFVVLVTHAEVIRAVLLSCLEAPLGDWPRYEIAPASVTTLSLDSDRLTLHGASEPAPALAPYAGPTRFHEHRAAARPG